MTKFNGTMMQFFEWYLPDDGQHWKRVTKEAKHLRELGISAVWLPPAYKGNGGIHDVGYGVYDLYDIGEFNQKGSIPTKYGTKAQYVKAIKTLHKNHIQVYADMVFNHKMGADKTQQIEAVAVNASNREEVLSSPEMIEAWTCFEFPQRKGKYSTFKWNASHFNGVDFDQRSKKHQIYRFDHHNWDRDVDKENGNYDYLMGADLDFENEEVLHELDYFGQWYLKEFEVDGFRMDACKHINAGFFAPWLEKLRKYSQKELFTVGEYWSPSLEGIKHFLERTKYSMSLFDVPLHFNFYKASRYGGNYDMSKLLDYTLVKENPTKAVTFVENHDTQSGQALETVIMDWFKPIAYAVILLRDEGYPCIFYGDYYGIPSKNGTSFRKEIDIMMKVRNEKVYGRRHDYFDHFNVIGWSLEGDMDHVDSGCAVIASDGEGGNKVMYVGRRYANQIFVDVMGNIQEEVKIDREGYGNFIVQGGSVSVWVKKQADTVNKGKHQ